MVAVLKQIEAKPAIRPRYINRNLAVFSRWYRDNEPALGEYWLAMPDSEQGEFEDFREFVMCQHDAEQSLRAAALRSTYGTREEQEQFYAERSAT